MTQPSLCRNCDHELTGPFCAGCGQRDVEPDRGLFEVVAELVGEAFEADGRLHRTAIPFLFKPGQITAEWMEGKRARFTPPARIFVFALFVGFVGVSVDADRRVAATSVEAVELDEEGVMQVESGGSSMEISFEGMDAEQFGTQREVMQTISSAVVDEGPKLMVLLVPVLAILLKLVLWPQLALKHLVFSLHLHSRLLILGGVALVLPTTVPQAIVLVAMQAYLLLGLRRAYGLAWRPAIWRYLLIAVLYATTWLSGIIALAVWATVTSFG